jgi:ABC-type enterobactin transport system permease subunit
VRDYQAYVLAVVRHEGRPRLLMAPDQKGRVLAAVFTASDAFEAFGPDAKARSGGDEVQEMRLDGRRLFTVLQAMQLDGIVFNCAGPVAPVAFAAAFAKIALEG